MKISLLDASTLGDDLDLSLLNRFGDVDVYPATNPADIASRCQQSDVVVINKIKINSDTLPDKGKLSLICVSATGYDNIDIDYCKKCGIAVTNVVGYSTDSVAQVTVSMVLYLANNLKSFSEFVTSGGYTQSGVANKLTPVYHELCGKTWGIVGGGNIGSKVASVAEALGCRIVVCKRTPHVKYRTVDIDTLCSESDIITIHTPLSESTRHLINADRISEMKKNVVIVNTARGAVTDEEAICEGIMSGSIGAFGTDVYSVEPFDTEHPFNRIMHMPNVLLTPHMAWGSYEARSRCLDEIIKNIECFIDGGLRNRLDV